MLKVKCMRIALLTLLTTSFCFGEITPPVKPPIKDPIGLNVSTDFLYWIAEVEGLDYAVGGVSPNGATTLKQGSVHSPHGRWDPGFRVGIEGVLPHDDWTLGGVFTWIKNKENASRITQAAGDNTLISTWTFDADDLFQSMNKVTGKWQIIMSQADIDLGRNFYISRFLTLHPSAGLKGAWGKQKTRFEYTETVLDSDFVTRLNMIEHFNGFGLKGQMIINFILAKHWAINSRLSFASLWSRFSTWNRYTLEDVEGSPVIANFKDKAWTLAPVLEMSLGIKWDMPFASDSAALSILAAYETQWWKGYNANYNLKQGSVNGDLSYQGLTLRFLFSF